MKTTIIIDPDERAGRVSSESGTLITAPDFDTAAMLYHEGVTNDANIYLEQDDTRNELMDLINAIKKRHPNEVCDLWFARPGSFVAWAVANGYHRGDKLQRLDTKKPYRMDNCFWARGRQAHTQIFITHAGRRQSLVKWGRELGIPYNTLYGRWAAGKTPAEILKT